MLYRMALNDGETPDAFVMQEHEVPDDSNLEVHCFFEGAAGTSGGRDLQFFKNGQFLQLHEGLSVSSDSSGVRIKIGKFNSQFAGTYECNGKRTDGNRSKAFLKLLPKTESAAGAQLTQQESCSQKYAGYCANGGTCLKDSVYNTISCRCRTGFKGIQCEFSEAADMGVHAKQSETMLWRNLTVACSLLSICMLILAVAMLMWYFRKSKALKQKQIPNRCEIQQQTSLTVSNAMDNGSISQIVSKTVCCPNCSCLILILQEGSNFVLTSDEACGGHNKALLSPFYNNQWNHYGRPQQRLASMPDLGYPYANSLPRETERSSRRVPVSALKMRNTSYEGGQTGPLLLGDRGLGQKQRRLAVSDLELSPEDERVACL